MGALEKQTRRKIFYAMVLAFAVVAPLAILYSRGYVFDLHGGGLVATGGVFVKTIQPGARVFVNSDFSRETSFISRGALITNLLPKRYAVRVEKDGFKTWSKVVRVANEEVLEFRNIFLPPATITPRAIYSTRNRLATRLVPLPGRREVALEVGNPNRPFTVSVVHPDTGLAPLAFVKVSKWHWDPQSRTFVVGRVLDGQLRWYRLRIGGEEREEAVAFRGLPSDFSAEALIPHPTDADAFYFFAGDALFLQGRSSVPVPIAEQLHAFAIGRERIYFLSKNGFFASSDLTGGDTKILGRKGLLLDDGAPARIIVSPRGDVVAFDAANGLFLYQPERDQELELIAGNVEGVDFSASGDRLLYWDEHRLWIYWLRDNPEQPFDLARTRKQVYYSDPAVASAFLDADGAHIYFATERGIQMVEVDDRAGVNAYRLVEQAPDGFAIDPLRLILYWLSGATLFRAALNP